MTLPLILIVDDKPESLSLVGELLQPHYAVRVANSGVRALQLAQLAPQPELILLDLVMPGMHGLEVLRALRDTPSTADIPVLLLTVLDSDDDEAHGLLQGAADYISKPVRPAVLLARVALQLALRAGDHQLRQARRQVEAALQQQQLALLAAQTLAPLALGRLADARQPGAARHQRLCQDLLRSLALQLQRRAGAGDGAGDGTGVDTEFGTGFGTVGHGASTAAGDTRQTGLLLQAAALRDIGMLSLPDRVLHKPGPLTADERLLVQQHARVGAEALAGGGEGGMATTPWLPLAREIALHHHERWDGQGYPDGLVGAAIPWPVRLVSLVDVYAALTAQRPHRPAWSHASACALISADAGRQFDPVVVGAFSDVCSDWPAIMRRHG